MSHRPGYIVDPIPFTFFNPSLNSDCSACTIAEEQIVIRKGVPFEEILKIAQESSADLIVIGTNGYGMVQHALMGGTARRLLRRSEKPILVVPRL